jgi:hypothetical protein
MRSIQGIYGSAPSAFLASAGVRGRQVFSTIPGRFARLGMPEYIFHLDKPVSKTQFIEFGRQGFWAYDVAVGVFLKHLIDAAEGHPQGVLPWLKDAISMWRFQACFSDFGMTIEEKWTPHQLQTFLTLAEQACAALEQRESIPAQEIVSWPLLEDYHVFPRGAEFVATAPVVELARAIIALVKGELVDAPKGQIWLYGTPEGRTTIGWSG